MGAGGLKKLDVNHSTPEIGLGLGVSIKTINFLDIKTRRYTKNIKRVDGELRAEAQDYHRRQPFSVLAAVIFMPRDSAEDGAGEKSSLRHAWEVFRGRAGRNSSDDPHERFERLWIGLYETGTEQLGEIRFFEAGVEAPLRGAPSETVGFGDVIAEITATFEGRNRK